jgi:UDP-glucose 4-epimerase
MRALVTGASGFLGARLLSALTEQGHRAAGLVRQVADLSDSQAVLSALRGRDCDVVFHVAAHIPRTAPDDAACFRSNAAGTLNLLEALKAGATRSLVYVSSTNVYGRPEVIPTPESLTPRPLEFYGLTKLVGEELCESYARRFGFRVAVLRPCGIHGPGRTSGALATWAKRALNGEPLFVPSRDSTKAFVHVSDVVEACLRAWADLRDEMSVYNVAPDEEVSLRDLAEAVRREAGNDVPVQVGDLPADREAYDVRRLRDDLGLTCRSATDTIREIVRHHSYELAHSIG